MERLANLWEVNCNQCHWTWVPRTSHPQRCVNPKCQSRDWDKPFRKKRKYTKSWELTNIKGGRNVR